MSKQTRAESKTEQNLLESLDCQAPATVQAMDDVIKLVKTYRFTQSLPERLRLAEQIFQLIGPDLKLYVAGSVHRDAAADVFQEVLKAVAVSLARFSGSTVKEFWAWAYRITRNKISDHFRKHAADRAQPMPVEELHALIDASARTAPFSPADRLDLDYAMKLLHAAKPDCHQLLWQHYVIGLDYGDLAEEYGLSYDAARMKVTRCLHDAQALVA